LLQLGLYDLNSPCVIYCLLLFTIKYAQPEIGVTKKRIFVPKIVAENKGGLLGEKHVAGRSPGSKQFFGA